MTTRPRFGETYLSRMDSRRGRRSSSAFDTALLQTAPETEEAHMPPCLSASERAYQQLKTHILQGDLRAGPLDIRLLGDRLRMSATPVREALARLSAERLVSLARHHGYAIAYPSSKTLEHLYELAGDLIDLCLDRIIQSGRKPIVPDFGASCGFAGNMTRLVEAIAGAQPNLELRAQTIEVNLRLLPARRCEPHLFASAREFDDLLAASVAGDLKRLRMLLHTQFASRRSATDALAQLLVEEAALP